VLTSRHMFAFTYVSLTYIAPSTQENGLSLKHVQSSFTAHAPLSENAHSQQWKAMCAQKEVYAKEKQQLQDELEINLARLQKVRGNRQTSTVESQNDENVWYVALCESIFQEKTPTGGVALGGKDVSIRNGMIRHQGKTPSSAKMLRQKILHMAEAMAKRLGSSNDHASKLSTLTPRLAHHAEERRRREERTAQESPEDYVMDIFTKLCKPNSKCHDKSQVSHVQNVTRLDFQTRLVKVIMPILNDREMQEITGWFMGTDETISSFNFVQKIINAPGGGGMGWGIEVSLACTDEELVNFFMYSLITYAKTRAIVNMHDIADEVMSIFRQVRKIHTKWYIAWSQLFSHSLG
jgi:hypothetical protein